MYKEFFGIEQKPFSIAPDPHFLYMSQGHREALAHLRYGLEEEGGFVLLTGEVGTGKTTVCRCLLELVPETTAIAYIVQPKLSSRDLLSTICKEFGINYPESPSSTDIFDALNSFLLSIHAQGKNAALIIDEAQSLSVETLEQVRLLTNLETDKKKLLQIVLLGQPELAAKLKKPELEQLSQRISARCHLGPLSSQDTKEYVQHRLAVVKMSPDTFSDRSLKFLYTLSAGIPRLINTICDRSLLAAYSKGVRRVDKSLLAESAKEVLGEERTVSLPFIPPKIVAGVTVAVCGLLLLCIQIISPGKAVDSPLEQEQQVIERAPETNQEKENSAKNVVAQKREKPPLKKAVWPVGKQTVSSEDLAFKGLLEQWGLDYPDNGQWPCQYVEEKGLRCIAKQSNIENLLRLNRPAVLHMKNDQGQGFFATLVNVADKKVILEINGELMEKELSGLSKNWAGDFVLIWRPPPGYKGSIRKGQKGKAVLWLSEQLAKIEGGTLHDKKTENVFDSEDIRIVKRLQRENGLVADGIAGKETLIVVNSLIQAKVPYLK